MYARTTHTTYTPTHGHTKSKDSSCRYAVTPTQWNTGVPGHYWKPVLAIPSGGLAPQRWGAVPCPGWLCGHTKSHLDHAHIHIPPGGEMSVAPTRYWVTCSSKPGVGRIFFPLWPFSVSFYLSQDFSSKVYSALISSLILMLQHMLL